MHPHSTSGGGKLYSLIPRCMCIRHGCTCSEMAYSGVECTRVYIVRGKVPETTPVGMEYCCAISIM